VPNDDDIKASIDDFADYVEPRQLFWVDIETTGLDKSLDQILEVGITRYDVGSRRIMNSISVAIAKSDAMLNSLNDFVKEMHNKSGLIDYVRQYGLPVWDAEDKLAAWLSDNGCNPEIDWMCGSSVHFDRAFLEKEMALVTEFFHYRNLDVSSIKNMCELYNPTLLAKRPKPQQLHRALPDIQDTIGEYHFYVDNFIYVQEDL
jgi:oligoribonuclease